MRQLPGPDPDNGFWGSTTERPNEGCHQGNPIGAKVLELDRHRFAI